MSEPLLQVQDLKVHFPLKGKNPFKRERKVVHAVDGIVLANGYYLVREDYAATVGIVREG